MMRTCHLRPLSRLQTAVILFVIFLVGYHLVPFLLGGGRKEGGGGGGGGGVVPPKTRARDRGIHFTSSGKGFVVEGKEKLILSGAIHYFRVPPLYWVDRLAKLKAAGLNTVETYMPWNLHEPEPGKFDFTGMLDVHKFISTAQFLELHVIVRPGPYICSEWDMGGLPAWLLHDPNMIVRTTYAPYMKAVEQYMTKVMGILGPLQSAYGGPIIALQIENEYGQYGNGDDKDSRDYMIFLYQLLKKLGVVELLFTSDGQSALENSLKLRPAPDVLITVNLMTDKNGLQSLTQIQPGKPAMVMEFWSGWFDHWNEPRLSRNQQPDELASKTAALLEAGVSLNYYMFHGGTNFGFMNGANWGWEQNNYQPTITSYDYDAPLSENGDTTSKFMAVRNTIQTHMPDVSLPSIPPNIPTTSYGEVKLTLYLPIVSTLQYLPEPHHSEKPIPMEMLPIHGCGQSYGFVLYRANIPSQTKHITIKQLKDYGVALIESVPVQTLSYFDSQSFLVSPSINVQNKDTGQLVLDILVENAGRVNFGHPLESRKGILGGVSVDGEELTSWKIYSLEFKHQFITDIAEGGMWQRTPPSMPAPGPALFKGSFTIDNVPKDTFLDMRGWDKGVVFVNGANLGRYWKVGPQGTLYVPAPILQRGVNQVIVFEMHVHKKPQTVSFRDTPVLDITNF